MRDIAVKTSSLADLALLRVAGRLRSHFPRDSTSPHSVFCEPPYPKVFGMSSGVGDLCSLNMPVLANVKAKVDRKRQMFETVQKRRA